MTPNAARRRQLLHTLAAGLACTWAPAHAVNPAPPPPQRRPLLIRGATLHPVTSAAIERGQLLIEAGRIRAVAGPAQEWPADLMAAADVMDASGAQLYPGFIAANTALGLVEVNAVRATVDAREAGVLNPNARSLVAVNADNEQLPVARANGVLAALAVPQPGPGGLISGQSSLLQLDGWTWEEMAVLADAALHVHLPSLRLGADLLPMDMRSRADELRRLTMERLRTLEQAFEDAQAHERAGRAGAAGQDLRLDGMRRAIRGEQPVFVHADELPQIRHALGLAARFGLKLVLVGGADAWRIAGELRQREVPVILAGVHRMPLRRDDPPDAPFRLAAQLHEAGVKIVIARSGSTFDAALERNLPYEAATAVAHGLPADAALRALTLSPAEVLGAQAELGSLEPGRRANVFLSTGNPLDARSRVTQVVMAGRAMGLRTRQSELEDKYRGRAVPAAGEGPR